MERKFKSYEDENQRIEVSNINQVKIQRCNSKNILTSLLMSLRRKKSQIFRAFPHYSGNIDLENLSIEYDGAITLSHPKYGVHRISKDVL